MIRTTIATFSDIHLDLVEPGDVPFDDDAYPFTLESVCTRCGAVVAQTTFEVPMVDTADTDQAIADDATQAAIAASLHRCPQEAPV